MGNWPTFKTGLNPYGLTYHLGMQGKGTPRENRKGRGLEGFLDMADEIGAQVIEIFDPWLSALSDDEGRALRDRLDSRGVVPVVSGSFVMTTPDSMFRSAGMLGADTIRVNLTDLLCGDRAARADWDELRTSVARKVTEMGQRAAGEGRMLAIENHQDFTSAELVEMCGLAPGGVGITYDTGNSFPVGEAPLDFTRAIAAHVRHVHLKDYRVKFTDEGFALHRCAIGDGAVPFPELFAILGEHHETMTAVLEPGSLDRRHIRLFTPEWWNGYEPRTAQQLAACLLAAQVNRIPDGEDPRTPWERAADDEIAEYELAQIRRSIDNMKSLGLF